MQRSSRSDIILIGPVRAGKSTLSKLLSQALDLPRVSLDDLRWPYYREIGYDEALARTIRHQGGFLALVLYWQLFDVYAIERALAEHQHCVFDCGAGTGAYESQEDRARLQRVLAPYRYPELTHLSRATSGIWFLLHRELPGCPGLTSSPQA